MLFFSIDPHLPSAGQTLVHSCGNHCPEHAGLCKESTLGGIHSQQSFVGLMLEGIMIDQTHDFLSFLVASAKTRNKMTHPVVLNALQNRGLHALHDFGTMLFGKKLCAVADCLPDSNFCVLQKPQATHNNALPFLEILLMLQQDLQPRTCRSDLFFVAKHKDKMSADFSPLQR